MTAQIDETLLDSIVAGVLDRLRGTSAPPIPASGGRQPSENETQRPVTPRGADAPRSPIVLTERVITEAILESNLNGATSVRFAPKAVLTPSARDYLRVHGIEWAYSTPVTNHEVSATPSWAVLIVRSTPAVERVVADVMPGARKELLGCPDDAATLAISEISRGGFSQAIIFADQTYRAACLANRHAAVKAVAVSDANEVKAVRRQLRANTWCLDPTECSRFELARLLKTILQVTVR